MRWQFNPERNLNRGTCRDYNHPPKYKNLYSYIWRMDSPACRALQETYLMASIANDKAIIEELTNGSGDIHSLTAYMAYPEIPRDTPITSIKKQFHNLRQEAKGIEFAINKTPIFI